MPWNWQQPDWPKFIYDSTVLEPPERKFLLQSGEFIGACKHIGADDQETLKIELIGDEAVKTSAIEGEILNRDSVQSSLRQQFGLGVERPGVTPAERGISQMMADLYRNFAAPLSAGGRVAGLRAIRLVRAFCAGRHTEADPGKAQQGIDSSREERGGPPELRTGRRRTNDAHA
jgi:Fic family protein